ncbi:MAG: DUF3179 domain-containing protein [Candidatus Kariarchaeaceae archaeon]|jgi:hypothetical protein
MISLVNGQTVPNSSGTIALSSLPEGAPIFQTDEIVDVNQNEPDEECLVPCNQIVTGASKDGIPSIDNPVFLEADSSGAPANREKVIGVVINGEARAYSYDILNWHEIVNDVFNGIHTSITYCPLTGSGILYHTSALSNSELGTSGKLYENNLVFYDRNTDTRWSQMAGVGLQGEQIGVNLTYSEAVETTWETWKKLHPDTTVLSRDTGQSRNYDRYPYSNYRSDSSIYFPTTFNPDIEPYNLYHEKALTQILKIDGETLLLPFGELAKVPAFNHNFNGEPLVTISINSEALAITYSAVVNDVVLTFSPFDESSTNLGSDLTLDLPLFIDNNNNIWNFNGLAISGALSGTQLNMIPTYNAFWFAASTFFYDASILIIDGDYPEVVTETSNLYTSFSVEPEFTDSDILTFSPLFLVAFVVLLVPRHLRSKNKSK